MGRTFHILLNPPAGPRFRAALGIRAQAEGGGRNPFLLKAAFWGLSQDVSW
jgi:hypothetical protein